MRNGEPTGHARPIRQRLPAPRPDGPATPGPARPRQPRPDPRPVRTLVGFAGFAALSAFGTAMILPSAGADTLTAAVVGAAPQPSVVHVTRYVHLAPGQTAPPNSTVQAAPAATPRTVIVTTTRQSGKP
jgi:hypothetical protein